jgi:para-aminobenzoate synthetase component I
MTCPLIHKIDYQDPLPMFAHFAEKQNALLLDSAQLHHPCGRYSFIAVDPFCTLSSKNGMVVLNGESFAGDPFQVLKHYLAQFVFDAYPDLPPFQGGAAGYFSYDLYQHLETVPLHKTDDLRCPDIALGFYDIVIAFDHEIKKAWIFSSGFPMKDALARKRHAKERLQWMLHMIHELKTIPLRTTFPLLRGPIMSDDSIHANFTAENYQRAVQKTIEYILAGDVFETCISQRFKTRLPDAVRPFDLYCRMRSLNPAPFSAYFKSNDLVIASASPERFLKLAKGQVESRPIKGTRPRGKNKIDDKALANELMASEKDRAENVMIVDLLRNDLSRVCEDHSVAVPQLCGLESYPAVHHLVSVIKGKLLPHLSAVDLLRAAFPGGSITGAPKIRAMEIIAELEPTQRGPYCGCMGYIGFNGDMDSSIIIRTYVIKNNIVTFQAGGAIVLDSDPVSEYQETLTKAHALRRALTYDFTDW